MTRPKVFIAGSFNTSLEVFAAMSTWNELWEIGFAPLCPQLAHFLDIEHPRPPEEWLEYALEWLPLCDALLILSGTDEAAVEEKDNAESLNIPVYSSVQSLVRGWKTPNKAKKKSR